MSTVLLFKGKLYSDSQGTDSVTGEKNFNTNKLFKMDNKRYGVTGTLEGWEHFKSIILEKNIFKKILQYIQCFKERQEEKSWIICYDDRMDKIYTYNHRWYGWRKFSLLIKSNNYACMGSGSIYWDDDLMEDLVNGNIDPESMIELAMEKDNFSGGRIVVM